MRKVKKRLKITKTEKFLYAFTALLVVATPITIVFSKAALSQVNYEVEKANKSIATQEKKNESLSMAINELASLDKIQEVAESQGLSYNNNNIKSISE